MEINLKSQNLLIFKKNVSTKPKIKYSFNFISLITPHKITNIRLLNNPLTPFKSKKSRKLFTKQSYLLMTWLWYIQKNHSSSGKPSFAFKPTRTHKTTLIKSPMAHKTFSQEQFQFKFFNLVISFYIPFKRSNNLLNINQMLHLILSLKTTIPFVETNFFMLKRFRATLPLKDSTFLKL
jgi:hypothetical protein